MPVSDAFHIYDTTLRISAKRYDQTLIRLMPDNVNPDLGVGFIEGGWPGANPKDTEFFKLSAD
jgi:2-isopropylmalate synthase